MYSILIKSSGSQYVFATDETTNEKFVGTLAETKEKFLALLEKYPISKLVVVHNTEVTNDLTIADVDE